MTAVAKPERSENGIIKDTSLHTCIHTYTYIHTQNAHTTAVAKPERSENGIIEDASLQFGTVLQKWKAKSPQKSTTSSQQNSQANSQSNSRRESIDLDGEESEDLRRLMQGDADVPVDVDAGVDGVFDHVGGGTDLSQGDGERHLQQPHLQQPHLQQPHLQQPHLQQEEERQDGEETSAQDLSYEDLLIQQYAEKQADRDTVSHCYIHIYIYIYTYIYTYKETVVC
jgi:hypothetical protein